MFLLFPKQSRQLLYMGVRLRPSYISFSIALNISYYNNFKIPIAVQTMDMVVLGCLARRPVLYGCFGFVSFS